jgi:hypothetical protein
MLMLAEADGFLATVSMQLHLAVGHITTTL